MTTLRSVRYVIEIMLPFVFGMLGFVSYVAAEESEFSRARDVLRQITVRVVVKGEASLISTGFFIHREGFVLTSGVGWKDSSSGILVLPNERSVDFVEVLHNDSLTLLLVKDTFDVPAFEVPQVANSVELQELDTALSRSGIGPGSLVSRVGYVSYVPKLPERDPIIVQSPCSPACAGAPFVNTNGRMMGMLSSGLKLDPTNFAKMLHISGLLKELSSMEKIDAAKDVLSPFIQMEDDALVCRFSTDSEVELTGHVNEVGRHKVKDRLELDLAILAAQIRQIPSIEIKGLYKDGSKWSKVVEVTKNSIHLQPAFSLPPTE